MIRQDRTVVFALSAMLLAVACGGQPAPPPADDDGGADAGQPLANAQRQSRVLPLPGEAPAPQAAAGGPLRWTVPEDWVQTPPGSSMRVAQYRVPGPGGDGECVVYYFGPGQGGDAASNAIRWARQFEQPDGRPSEEVMTMAPLEGTPVPVQLVEVTGIYDGGMTMTDAPAEKRASHMLLGTIAETAAGPWFFKFTGPESTVRAQRENFLGMMQSLGGGS